MLITLHRLEPSEKAPTEEIGPQAYRWLSTRAKISANSPAEDSATPGRSRAGERSARISGTRRMVATAATIPIGTFRKKIDCQSKLVTSQPPTVGPTTTASPATELRTPNAAPRRAAGKMLERTVRVCGVS